MKIICTLGSKISAGSWGHLDPNTTQILSANPARRNANFIPPSTPISFIINPAKIMWGELEGVVDTICTSLEES